MREKLRERDLVLCRSARTPARIRRRAARADLCSCKACNRHALPRPFVADQKRTSVSAVQGVVAIRVAKTAVQIERSVYHFAKRKRRAPSSPKRGEIFLEEKRRAPVSLPSVNQIGFKPPALHAMSERSVNPKPIECSLQITACSAFRSGSFFARSRKELSILKLICKFASASCTLPRSAS